MFVMNTVNKPPRGRPSEPTDERLALVNRYLRRVGNEQDQLIQTLHVAQEIFGYLSPEVLAHVAHALRLPESRVYGVATFYHLFSFDPPGDHSCTVCTGTACHVKGADAIVSALSDEFGLAPGETREDGSFTLGTTRCLGSCGLAPMLVLDGEVHSHQDAASAVTAVRSVLADAERV
jgi:bidirectional [NiFe] hydrogenase diaphorase subunit